MSALQNLLLGLMLLVLCILSWQWGEQHLRLSAREKALLEQPFPADLSPAVAEQLRRDMERRLRHARHLGQRMYRLAAVLFALAGVSLLSLAALRWWAGQP